MTLDCYGDEIVTLADLAGSFDPASKTSTDTWWVGEWEKVARRLGWSQTLEKAVVAAKQSQGDIVGLRSAPHNAFNQWFSAREAVFIGDWDDSLVARVRHEAVLAFRNRPNTWMAVAPSWDTPYGACASGVRAFASTQRPSYFRAGEGATPRGPGCVWEGQVRLCFGAFPYVSGRMGVVADGLTWTGVKNWRPAQEAMRICSEFWEPAGNARQDAREVVKHWAEFRTATASVVDGLPETPTSPGAPYRMGLRVAVHLGSEESLVFPGPRGPLAASAYNYVVERYAAFFACRRSILENFSSLSGAVQNSLRANPDPCVEPFTTPAPPAPAPVPPKPPITPGPGAIKG